MQYKILNNSTRSSLG